MSNNAALVGGLMTIGSHSETMVTEERNVENSKTELENKFMEYLEDNQALTTDWQGDTADIFMKYSVSMNGILNATIETTNVFGLNISNFYNQSLFLDTQASINTEGDK